MNMLIKDIYDKINRNEYESLRKIIVNYFPETEDNVECGDIITISKYVNPDTERKVVGLTIDNADLFQMAYAIEGDENIIKLASKIYPNLTENQIEAYFRFVTLIFASLERDIDK